MLELDSARGTSEQSIPNNLPGITHLDIIWWVEKKIDSIIRNTVVTSLKWKLISFKKLYQQKKADYYIKQWRVLEIVYRMNEYSLLDPKVYHPRIVDAVIKRWDEWILLGYLEKFTGLDSEIYHPRIMETLIKKRWYWNRVINNIEKFVKFSPILADVLIENYKWWLLGSNLEKFIELDYTKVTKDLILIWNDQIDNFIKNSPNSCRKNIADALIENDKQWYIRNHIELFSELDPYIYHSLLFDYILARWEIFAITEIAEKLSWIDQTRIKKLSELHRVINEFRNNLTKPVNHLDTYTALTPTQLIHAIMRSNGGQFIIDNLEKFTQILDQTSIVELLMKQSWLENENIKILVSNLERLTEIDTKIYHAKIINTLIVRMRDPLYVLNRLEKFSGISHSKIAGIFIERWQISILLDNIEKFTEIDLKFKTFLTKIQSKKSDIEILKRYEDLNSIRWFDDIFVFYIQNKQKSLIPMIQKLLIAKDIGVKTNFTSISNLIDTYWIKNMDPKTVKIRLEKTFAKLSELTGIIIGKTELSNLLRNIKTFNDNTIEQVQKKFANIVEIYFNAIYDRKVKQRFINELWLTWIDNLNETLVKSEFIEWFKMYQATIINKDQFKQILQHAINNPHSTWDISVLEKNQKWLNSEKIGNKNMKLWQERNEQKYTIWESNWKVDKTKNIEHFVNIANIKLELLGLKAQENSGNLVNYFNSEVKKNIETLRKNSKLSVKEFETLYNDLILQVQSLNNLFKESKAKTITSITIYKETNPVKVLMMGNVVDGSCLNFYSIVWNYWSTATNALDINKWVFFIEDQSGNIIGRVLTAIDNEWKLLRFRTYVKWNIEVNLSNYFNEYIKSLAEKIWLKLNGDIRKVDLLNGKKWYEDPVEMIP